MRLIDADLIGLTNMEIIMCNGDYKEALKMLIDKIDNAPTIEPERKAGKWLDGHRAGYGESLYWYIYCSECLWERDDDDHDKDTPYCPSCGARLEGAKQE